MKQNVYIATVPHSGSTPLGMALGQHSLIHHGGEAAYVLVDPQVIVCPCGLHGCNFLTAVYRQVMRSTHIKQIFDACVHLKMIEEPKKFFNLCTRGVRDATEAFNAMIPDVAGLVSDLAALLPDVAKGFEELAEIYRNLTDKQIVVDNSKFIRIAEHLVTLDGWKIIILTRDPRALAYANKQSEIRRGVPRPLELKIPVYIDFANRAIGLTGKSNVFQVSYEDLCGNPSEWLTRICDFIEVDYEPCMLNLRATARHTVNGNRMRFDVSNDTLFEEVSWKSNDLAHDLIAQVLASEELVTAYKKLRYKLP